VPGVRRSRKGRTPVHGRTSLASPLKILFDLSGPVADPRSVLSSTVLTFTPVSLLPADGPAGLKFPFSPVPLLLPFSSPVESSLLSSSSMTTFASVVTYFLTSSSVGVEASVRLPLRRKNVSPLIPLEISLLKVSATLEPRRQAGLESGRLGSP